LPADLTRGVEAALLVRERDADAVEQALATLDAGVADGALAIAADACDRRLRIAQLPGAGGEDDGVEVVGHAVQVRIVELVAQPSDRAALVDPPGPVRREEARLASEHVAAHACLLVDE